MTSTDETPAGFEPIHDVGFIDHVGPVYRRADGAYGFRAAQKHANLIQVVHGGMLMSFADRALGETAMAAADGANCVTIQMEMQFIDVARLGDWIEARPEVVRRTGSLVFLRTDLRAGERRVAAATGVWKILRRRPDAVAPERAS
ncbi:PaaI family thioesterase [Methylobacterium dankookense]|uniref:Thioesterase domain-containing protein n=1 Tax=Methylobacterium dankookense TaxID=560405 RepID=A0A564FTW6_9HYPH|nr:PaaI family thioesterase [Methylobacterium dankookense]GJD54151.1 hypothetical protein IFDJLNFL_0018 [Methylobacterium dankookense]VUF11120.1 hypothetical protein MTDSW087_00793 [Methylobacterium dankookense]